MSLRSKLVAIVLFVGLVPLTVSALLALGVHQRAYDGKIAELHQRTAEFGAARAQAFVDEAARGLALLGGQTVRWGALSPDERAGALWLVYRQRPEIVAASLLDGAGRGVGETAYRRPGQTDAELDAHAPASLPLLQAFAAHIPFAAAAQAKAIGEPFVVEGRAVVALAVPADLGAQRGVVALALSLDPLCTELARAAPEGTRVSLVDRSQRVLCGEHAGEPLPDERDVAAAAAPLPLGWTVVTRQPRAEAFASSRTLELQTLFGVALALGVALAAGLFLARGINRPVARLAEAARELERGNFAHRLPPELVQSRDELGQLSAAFDQMSTEIAERDREIRAFNDELQARVEARTRELREAEEQLLRSQKIAAVGALGAGIAHEINNPLTAVLGFTQVLLAKTAAEEPDRAILTTMETEAKRIRGIVSTLLSFSQSYGGVQGMVETDLNRIVEAALAEVPPGTLDPGTIEVLRELEPTLAPVLGSPAQLQEAVAQLVGNAVTAMGERGRLTLRTSSANGLVRLEVIDTGRGIAPEHLDRIFDPFFTTKDSWRGEGLGLTLVHRIVEEHHGKIKAVSRVGEGSTFTVTLPAVTRRAHLS
jgi:signal transduction histidine kinase